MNGSGKAPQPSFAGGGRLVSLLAGLVVLAFVAAGCGNGSAELPTRAPGGGAPAEVVNGEELAGQSCSACHGDFSGQVETSACVACHPADGYPDSGLFALHGGLEAPNGDYCGYCHTGVGAENHSWTGVKALFD